MPDSWNFGFKGLGFYWFRAVVRGFLSNWVYLSDNFLGTLWEVQLFGIRKVFSSTLQVPGSEEQVPEAHRGSTTVNSSRYTKLLAPKDKKKNAWERCTARQTCTAGASPWSCLCHRLHILSARQPAEQKGASTSCTAIKTLSPEDLAKPKPGSLRIETPSPGNPKLRLSRLARTHLWAATLSLRGIKASFCASDDGG